jgi:hypothetical protein
MLPYLLVTGREKVGFTPQIHVDGFNGIVVTTMDAVFLMKIYVKSNVGKL